MYAHSIHLELRQKLNKIRISHFLKLKTGNNLFNSGKEGGETSKYSIYK